ncbi:MAG: hypothetical protein B6D44_00600 [Ignavibacteriales bacterium UTCHB2]|jgi:ribosomal protein L32|nr:MAG: hypothetical protein B6D44_00600 [Ignavibacteriales bacterium UTCHB2]
MKAKVMIYYIWENYESSNVLFNDTWLILDCINKLLKYLGDRRFNIMANGYIYILSNPVMSGLIKIGYTLRDVQSRVKELSSSTSIPVPFEIEYYCLTRDVEELEKEIHFRLGKYRQNGSEFFTIPLEIAVNIIDSMIRSVAEDRFCRKQINTNHFMKQDSSVKGTLYQCPKCGEKNSSSKICVACGYVYG